MDKIDPEVKKIALAMCRYDRYAEDRQIEIAPGFSIPRWLIYVSRAMQLVADRDVLNGKPS